MMLGKRPTPAVFRRTTSITEFTIDLLDVEPINVSDDVNNNYLQVEHQRVLSTISPRNYTNLRSPLSNSSHNSHFLSACGLCNRPLAPGRDIYMYRGDTAFCSEECREQQITQDEKKEKSSTWSPYTPTNNIESSTITVGSEGCNPVAAA